MVDRDDLSEDVDRQIETAVDRGRSDPLRRRHPRRADAARRGGRPAAPLHQHAGHPGDEQGRHSGVRPAGREFYKLGRGKPIAVSTQQNRNKKALLKLIEKMLPAGDDLKPADAVMKIAVVGRPNTGKSTFINTLAHAERMIVSERPGTTRDSVDVHFELDGLPFMAIDTAGVKRKAKIRDNLDFYSIHRAERSIRRADVVLLFLDPTQGISRLDKQMADYIAKQYKPCIFAVNKWDLMLATPTTRRAQGSMAKYAHIVQHAFRSMSYMPLAFITAKTGKNVKALLNLAQSMYKQAQRRVGTGTLNRVLREAVEAHPARRPREPATRGSTTRPRSAPGPPTIVLFVNSTSLFDATYQRYLLNVFREKLPFHDIPIKLYLRSRSQTDPVDPDAARSDDDPTVDDGLPDPNGRSRDRPPPRATPGATGSSTARSTKSSPSWRTEPRSDAGSRPTAFQPPEWRTEGDRYDRARIPIAASLCIPTDERRHDAADDPTRLPSKCGPGRDAVPWPCGPSRVGHRADRPDPAEPPQAEPGRLLLPPVPPGQAAQDGPVRLRQPRRRHGARRRRADLVLLPGRRRRPTTCTGSSSTPSCSGSTSRARRSATTSASPEGPAREKQMELVRTWVDRAAELDAPVIRIFAGSVAKGDDEAKAVDRAIEGIKASLPYAAEQGVTLALENHGGITATPDQLLKLVKAVDAPNFGVNLDTGNFHGDDPYADLAEARPLRGQRPGQDRDQPQGQKKEEADLAKVDRHPPRRALLRLRRPRVRGRGRPDEGRPAAHQDAAEPDRRPTETCWRWEGGRGGPLVARAGLPAQVQGRTNRRQSRLHKSRFP